MIMLQTHSSSSIVRNRQICPGGIDGRKKGDCTTYAFSEIPRGALTSCVE